MVFQPIIGFVELIRCLNLAPQHRQNEIEMYTYPCFVYFWYTEQVLKANWMSLIYGQFIDYLFGYSLCYSELTHVHQNILEKYFFLFKSRKPALGDKVKYAGTRDYSIPVLLLCFLGKLNNFAICLDFQANFGKTTWTYYNTSEIKST